MVAVAYRSGSFSRGSNCKSLTGKIWVFWIGGSLSVIGGDRLREVVTNGGSTVLFFDTI